MSPSQEDELFDCLLVRQTQKKNLQLRGQLKIDKKEAFINLVTTSKIFDYALAKKEIRSQRVSSLLKFGMTFAVNPSS